VSDQPRVFVTRRLPGATAAARLAERCAVDTWPDDDPPPPAELAGRSSDCDGILAMITDAVDASLLDRCSKLRVVAQMAVGYDNIDVDAATERGVLVTNTPDVLTDATADLAWALIMAAARRLSEGERAIRAGEWGPWHPSWLTGAEVTGATLGIVGPGRIGRAVAERAAGFRMRVLYCGRHALPDFPGEHAEFDDLLARSDFISVHVPLTPETAHLFDADAFERMQPHAILINTARGGIVDQDALRAALSSGRIGGAALDVTTPEPLPLDDSLLAAPNLTITPHLGSATLQTRIKMAELAVDGLLAAVGGERPTHLVNPAAWERRRR
jgi:glyoxylate reductase